MDLLQAIEARRSVRAYEERPLAPQDRDALTARIGELNAESGLNMQLIENEPQAFGGLLAHYGHFSGVTSYIALVGPDSPALPERCGYFGERLVLFARQLGLDTCWVAGTYRKGKVKAAYQRRAGEKLMAVIAVGYGKEPGRPHRSRTFDEVAQTDGEAPGWFRAGVEAALAAPTAINQQRFRFVLQDGTVTAQALRGPYSKIDLGIVKCHFEIASGRALPPAD